MEPAVFKVAAFFIKGSGPHKTQLYSGSSKEFCTMVKAAEIDVNQNAPVASSSVCSNRLTKKTSFKVDTHKKTKEASMVKARDALAKKKSDLKSRRTINLSS